MNFKAGIILLAVAAGAGGCFSPEKKSLTSDSPASAVPAIKDAAQGNDRTAIPRLVADLDDDDPAIRFAAIQALERITGQTLAYRYYDSAERRRAAVLRWQQWLQGQKPNP